MPRSDRRNGPRKTPAVAVKHGHGPEINAIWSQPMFQTFANSINPSPAMGEHDALGKAGRATRVVNRNVVVFVDLTARNRPWSRALEEPLVIGNDVRDLGIGDQRVQFR